MDNLTKDTKVYCDLYDFFGTIAELKEHAIGIKVHQPDMQVSVKLCSHEPFVTVDDDFIIEMVQNEIERQGDDRSSDTGDEMDVVVQLIFNHMIVAYDAIMAKMPRLYYPEAKEIHIDLNDF